MEKSNQFQIRLEKLKYLEKKGCNAYGAAFSFDSNSHKIITENDHFSKEELEIKKNHTTLAGRVILKRSQGKAGFLSIRDEHGDLQLYINQKNLTEDEFDDYNHLDLGDIIGVSGEIFKTKIGELTLRVNKFTLLSKSLHPLPEKYHGLTDPEEIYRHRYVDLITNQKSREIFRKRSQIISQIRNYLDSQQYLEMETPILQTIAGGAAAKPFITHHNTLDIEMKLRIATELHLKRLMIGGFEKVYEIGRIFRNEGISIKHNPEFTSIELYQAYGDMETMMSITKEIFQNICQKICGSMQIKYGEVEIDFTTFDKIHMVDIIKNETGIDFWEKISLDQALELANKHSVDIQKHHFTVGHIINEFFEQKCEAKIIRPTFVYGHPVEVSPLSKQNNNDKRFTDRFELFIIKREYANGFSELNDPRIQLERFEKQVEETKLGNEESNKIDHDYIHALEYGMPPAGGLGIGIDRLVMLMTDARSIRDVILFPTMKEK